MTTALRTGAVLVFDGDCGFCDERDGLAEQFPKRRSPRCRPPAHRPRRPDRPDRAGVRRADPVDRRRDGSRHHARAGAAAVTRSACEPGRRSQPRGAVVSPRGGLGVLAVTRPTGSRRRRGLRLGRRQPLPPPRRHPACARRPLEAAIAGPARTPSSGGVWRRTVDPSVLPTRRRRLLAPATRPSGRRGGTPSRRRLSRLAAWCTDRSVSTTSGAGYSSTASPPWRVRHGGGHRRRRRRTGARRPSRTGDDHGQLARHHRRLATPPHSWGVLVSRPGAPTARGWPTGTRMTRVAAAHERECQSPGPRGRHRGRPRPARRTRGPGRHPGTGGRCLLWIFFAICAGIGSWPL